MNKLVVPAFATEDEEADWWFENRELVENELRLGLAEGRTKRGVPIPPSARENAVTVALDASDAQKARLLAKKQGVEYDVYLSMLIHQELEKTDIHAEVADAA